MGPTPFSVTPGDYEHGRRRWWRKRRKNGRRDCGDCGDCGDCNFCDFPLLSLLRLSTLLLVAAAVLPNTGGTALVSRAIAAYQRLLSRFTAVCPSTPSCSAYAASVVREFGARRGLRAAAARVRACSRAVQ